MLKEDEEQYLAKLLPPMQIIVLALLAGPGAFLAYVLLSQMGPPEKPNQSYMAAGFAAVAFLLWAIVPQLLVASSTRKIAAGQRPYRPQPGQESPPGMEQFGQLVAVYQTRLIIACSILEGAAFYNIFALMTEHQRWSLLIVAVLLLTILASFPTRGRLMGFVQRHLEAMEQFPT